MIAVARLWCSRWEATLNSVMGSAMPASVVAAELVEGEADRHHDEAEDGPPPASGEREALEGDRRDGQGVEGAGRQAAELRAVVVVDQRGGEQDRCEQGIPDCGA